MTSIFPTYDIIIVGSGHAGCEAAVTAAKLGSHVLLVTMNMHTIGQMSCNPAMGGIAKGQIIREIDALGGFSGIIADKSAIQFRMLNKSKGPAMWSPRTQNDRKLFAKSWVETLEAHTNIDFLQDTVTSLLVKDNRVQGVQTALNLSLYSHAVILTNGTFLGGLIHIGSNKAHGGRITESASTSLADQLRSIGFQTGRMKTGTSPRIDGRSVDYSKMTEQYGDQEASTFSFLNPQPLKKQKSCFITYTNPTVHQIIKDNIQHSPMYNGQISTNGPRYCPSIEDKVFRFADKTQHQIFVEPEGWNTIHTYVNGLSTSLPVSVQLEILRSIHGFKKVKMLCPGYAVEYDYFPPIQLRHTLETKLITNLYFAGQINGTTGYEEAACQGLVAAINAHRKIRNLSPFTLQRSEAYIGVLIDDLISKSTEEPYRMFTSRAEFRLSLRQDNADLRLTKLGHAIGLADDERFRKVQKKEKDIQTILSILKQWKIQPQVVNPILEKLQTNSILESQSAITLLKRPTVHLDDLFSLDPSIQDQCSTYERETLQQVEIQIKYESYLLKEREHIDKFKALESYSIPDQLDYSSLHALSKEAIEKLQKYKPHTLGQASRISGISPADISVLMVYLTKKRHATEHAPSST